MFYVSFHTGVVKGKHGLWQDAEVYSGIPKMSAVWKYFKLENESSPMSTFNASSSSILQGSSNRSALDINNLILHLKHSMEHSEFTQVSRAKAAPKQQIIKQRRETGTRLERSQRG